MKWYESNTGASTLPKITCMQDWPHECQQRIVDAWTDPQILCRKCEHARIPDRLPPRQGEAFRKYYEGMEGRRIKQTFPTEFIDMLDFKNILWRAKS